MDILNADKIVGATTSKTRVRPASPDGFAIEDSRLRRDVERPQCSVVRSSLCEERMLRDLHNCFRKHPRLLYTDLRLTANNKESSVVSYMLSIYTGNGKGKTTAALGLAMRAIGAGKRVGIIYFDKGGTHYSERNILNVIASRPEAERQSHGTIDWQAFGLDRIDSETGRFRFGVTPEDIAEAKKGLAKTREWVESGKYDLLILDEINSTTDLKMLEVWEVLSFLESKPKELELVFTGRNAPKEFLERANLVSEMTLVKHYFYKGIRAREGFDY